MKMNQESNDRKSNHQPASRIGAWMAIGVGIGVALGSAMDKLGAGLAIGIGIGVAIGAAIDRRRKQKDESNGN